MADPFGSNIEDIQLYSICSILRNEPKKRLLSASIPKIFISYFDSLITRINFTVVISAIPGIQPLNIALSIQ